MTEGTKSRARTPSSLPTVRAHNFALRRGRAQWFWLALGFGLLLALPAILPAFWLHITNLALIATVGAVALNLLSGNAQMVSLGQAAFLGIGGFTAGYLGQTYELAFPLVLAVSTVAGGILGLIVAIPSLRLRVMYVAVTTIALHFAVTTALNVIQAVAMNSDGMVLPDAAIGPLKFTAPSNWYYLLLAFAAAAVIAALNLLRSHVGRRWISVADHDLAAEALGISVVRSKLSVFVVSSAVVALAGALQGYYIGTVSYEAYTLGLAITYLAMIIVGGIGRVAGSVVGAFVIKFLPYLLDKVIAAFGIALAASSLTGLHDILYGGLIIGFLLFEPRGLVEVWRRIRVALADWPFRYRSAQRGSR